MLKSFIFCLSQVPRFEKPLRDYLPPLDGSGIGYYEEPYIQLIEEYVDYRQVLIYRLQAVVLHPCEIQVKCCRSDYHLLYPLEASADIRITRDIPHAFAITLTPAMATYVHIPKAQLRISLQPGVYTIYGLLIDIGMIRSEIFRNDHFLMQFRLQRQQGKKLLYQSALWPIAEKTVLMIQHIEFYFFPYHKNKESKAVELVYALFAIAEYKQFEIYEKLAEGQLVAQRARQMINDQINQTFSNLNIGSISVRLGISMQYLAKVHKKYFRETLLQYRDSILLEKAKRLLMQYDVTEVSNYCGFGQVSTFSDYFFKQTQMRPMEYKRLHSGGKESQ